MTLAAQGGASTRSITLTTECWRFIEEARRWPALIPLPADVHASLDATPEIEFNGAITEPRIVVRMTLRQARETRRWLQTLGNGLARRRVLVSRSAMPDEPAALSFRVTTADLTGAIETLKALGGLERYPEAYPVLVLERSRRELQSPPQEIRLSREAFEALPGNVRQLLMAHRG